MKATSAAFSNGIDSLSFTKFIKEKKLPYSENNAGLMLIDDDKVNEYVELFKKYKDDPNWTYELGDTIKAELEAKKAEEEERKKVLEALEAEVAEKIRNMILTTTPYVEGKKVSRYRGVVSGTDIYMVGGLLGGGLVSQESLFQMAQQTAIKHMIKKALSADAIIGIHTELVSPGGANFIIVVVTGTAVDLEDES